MHVQMTSAILLILFLISFYFNTFPPIRACKICNLYFNRYFNSWYTDKINRCIITSKIEMFQTALTANNEIFPAGGSAWRHPKTKQKTRPSPQAPLGRLLSVAFV